MYTRGMGEYPGFYCYDAGRPGWLPFWLDTLTEEMCKVKAIPGNIASCVNPLATDCASTSETGSWFNARQSAGLPVADANKDPTLSGPGIAPEGAPTNAPPEADYTWVALLVGGVALFSMLRN